MKILLTLLKEYLVIISICQAMILHQYLRVKTLGVLVNPTFKILAVHFQTRIKIFSPKLQMSMIFLKLMAVT